MSGEIPPELANLPLFFLFLSGNQLTGVKGGEILDNRGGGILYHFKLVLTGVNVRSE